jgi:hypothetical protein
MEPMSVMLFVLIAFVVSAWNRSTPPTQVIVQPAPAEPPVEVPGIGAFVLLVGFVLMLLMMAP